MNKLMMTLCLCIVSLTTYAQSQQPVNANANQTTKDILTYLHNLKGNGILSGQESTYWNWEQDQTPKLATQDKDIYNITGKYPAVYSSDFGDFALNNYQNTEAACNEKRDDVVNAIKEYAGRGALITMSYHMRPPTVGVCAPYESIKNPKDASGNYIPLTDAQIDQMITPGTSQYNTMIERFDQLAGYFKDLENDDITVLWRPFHEMNGGWFWWGQLTPSKYTALWNMMYDRLTNHHGCNNLLWVWSVNYYSQSENPSVYYPGNSKVDILGADIYTNFGHVYAQHVYNDLSSWGGGKPIAFTENGPMPDVSTIKNTMPNMVYWLTWFDHHHSGHNPNTLYQSNYSDPYTITLDELPDSYGGNNPNSTKFEAEDAALTGVNVSTNRAGYSGSGYVTGFDNGNDKITFTVNATSAGTYPLTIRYACSSNKTNDVYVNGNYYAGVVFPASATFADKQAGSISLNAGTNTIEIRKNWGWFDVDYIEVGIDNPPANNQAPTANAGSDKSITLPTNSLTISGSGSDSDGNIVSYSWTKISGGNVGMNGTSTPTLSLSNLVEGNYTFRLTVTDNDGATDTDNVSLTVNAQANSSGIYEAEDAALTGVNVSTNRAGYSGSGYVTGFDNGNDKITFTVNAPSSGSYPLTIRYACNSNKTNDVYVNGNFYDDVVFSKSTTFADKQAGSISLNAGSNTIEIRKNWGWFDVDYIEIDGIDNGNNGNTDAYFEAENGTLTGVNTSTSVSGYSGSAYVTGFDNGNDKVVVNANIPTAGTYELRIGYRANSTKKNWVSLNGSNLGEIEFPASSSFTEKVVGDYNFNSGNNTIEFRKSWGWMDVDYFRVVQTSQKVALTNTLDIQLYPNPANHSIQLTCEITENTPADIQIYDAFGKLVKHITDVEIITGSPVQVEVSQLPAGMYFCTLKSDKWQAVKKFVIAR